MPLPTIWSHAKGALTLNRPIIMGILNVTPDSFSDGGQFNTVPEAVEHARQLVALGADIIDVGGESTRPQGARQVGVDEELNRVVPVIRALVEELPKTLISVDTNKSVVAMSGLRAGAAIVNDVSGFRLDERMAGVCAAGNAGVVLMHSRGGVADTLYLPGMTSVSRNVPQCIARRFFAPSASNAAPASSGSMCCGSMNQRGE